MAVISSIIAAVGVAASIAGTAVSVMGAQKQAQAQKKAAVAQQQAEEARKKQMDLDAMRKKREVVREGQRAQAQALAITTAQGAAAEGSSALGGATGQINQQAGSALVGVNQNQEIGADIFAANSAYNRANQQSAAGASMASLGAGITSLGGTLTNQSKTIAKIGGQS